MNGCIIGFSISIFGKYLKGYGITGSPIPSFDPSSVLGFFSDFSVSNSFSSDLESAKPPSECPYSFDSDLIFSSLSSPLSFILFASKFSIVPRLRFGVLWDNLIGDGAMMLVRLLLIAGIGENAPCGPLPSFGHLNGDKESSLTRECLLSWLAWSGSSLVGLPSRLWRL